MTRANRKIAIFRNFAILTFAVLLAGCGAVPPATQTVYVPVYTPCVKDVPVAPVYEFDKLPLDASDGAKVLALTRDWPAGRKYEGMLESVLAGCLSWLESFPQVVTQGNENNDLQDRK